MHYLNFIKSSKDKIINSSTNSKKVEDLFEVKNEKNKHSASDMSLGKYGIQGDDDKTIGTVNDIFLNAMMKKSFGYSYRA
ncbi:MAG: hypothetical protein Q9M97_00615 [Candidatus Gracilibacteria bacterium]|nr:hypothetical protein [Candidatus Gracilibacteria bacterium]